MRPILALDLGTRTGFALQTDVTGRVSGTWRLDKRHPAIDEPELAGDIRMGRLFWRLTGILDSKYFSGGHILYEDVQFSLYTLQTQLWAGFRSVVWNAAMLCGGFQITPVPVGTLKKFGAGHGAATKDMMKIAYLRKHTSFNKPKVDDNEFDALHLLDYGLTL
jgi:hypothetical protein